MTTGGGEMQMEGIEEFDLFRLDSLLRAKDCGGAFRPVQRVGHVASDLDAHSIQQRAQGRRVNARYLGEIF